jgi:DNA-binding LacI/PurR family transcriptional regulator
MPKYEQLSNLLKTCIVNGDYSVKDFPAERQLALDHGVAHMTARRALKQLIDDGLLVRASNGRLEVNRTRTEGPLSLHIALMTPDFNSSRHRQWQNLITELVRQKGGTTRQILYTHWEDPFIRDSLNKFDGVFLLPSSERIPDTVKERLSQAKTCPVVLDADLSSWGIPSIRRFPPVFVQRLLDHLEEQGFRKIDCFNVQTNDEIIEQRIGQWRVWMNARRLKGRLINEEIDPYTEPVPHAYNVMKRLLASGELDAEVLFCVTTPAAIGAMRAIHEAGLRPGKDIAICTVDGESQAAYQIPSITALEAPDVATYVAPHVITCLQRMGVDHPVWEGPMLMDPSEPNLVIRETTMRG